LLALSRICSTNAAKLGTRAFVIVVQIHQSAEGPPFAAVEQPVDGPLFVGLDVVGHELASKVTLDASLCRLPGFLSAQCRHHKLQVFGARFGRKGHAQELREAHRHIVVEVCVERHGQDAVGVGGEGGVPGRIEGLDRVNQARFIQRVTAHHAAHRVGEKPSDVAAQIRDLLWCEGATQGVSSVLRLIQSSGPGGTSRQEEKELQAAQSGEDAS